MLPLFLSARVEHKDGRRFEKDDVKKRKKSVVVPDTPITTNYRLRINPRRYSKADQLTTRN